MIMRAFFRKAFQVQGQNDFDTMFLTHAGRGIRAILDQEGRWEGGAMTARSCRCITPTPSCICARNGCAGDASCSAQEFCGYSLGLLMNGLKDYIGEKG